MIALHRILIAHDFSATSDAATWYGIEMAREFGARVVLLHVGERARQELDAEFPVGLEGLIEESVRERLVKILPPAQQNELKPEFAVCAGTPAAEIVRYALEHQIDLIVMGSHGRGAVEHMLMGSVAEKVVRTAPCPVLTVREAPRPAVVPALLPVFDRSLAF